MKKSILLRTLILCLLVSLTACKEEIPETVPVTAVPTVAETTGNTTEPTEVTTADQLKQLEDHKVTVSFLPTDTGSWCNVDMEDQEAAVAAFEKAVSAIYSDEWWIKGDRTLGLQVEYKGEIWEFVESGELVYALGRVKAEDAADLYALCVEAARAAGWKDAVKPEQFTGIVSATLRVSAEEFTLTEPAAMDKLEGMLSSGKYELGGTGCPFTALLDAELESGEILSVALATNSCGVWMSEGYYYSYGSDSQPLFDLFGVKLEFGELAK